MPHGYYPLLWLTEGVALFIAFTVQGAMWSGAQQENRNGWVVALVWAVATLVLIEGSHAFHDALFPPCAVLTCTEGPAADTGPFPEGARKRLRELASNFYTFTAKFRAADLPQNFDARSA